MTVYHFFFFTSEEIILIKILVLISVKETLSQIKVVKVLSLRQARVSACQSVNSAKAAFLCLPYNTLPCSLCKQFFTSFNVCRLITKSRYQQKSKIALLTLLKNIAHLFFLWMQICTPQVKPCRVRTFVLFLSRFYIYVKYSVYALGLDLSLCCLTFDNLFQQRCIIEEKEVITQLFCFLF